MGKKKNDLREMGTSSATVAKVANGSEREKAPPQASGLKWQLQGDLDPEQISSVRLRLTTSVRRERYFRTHVKTGKHRRRRG